MRDIIFFQATGRSGTQWFAKQLQDVYNDLAVVTHEPIQYAYFPKRYLRRYDTRSFKEMCNIPQVRDHLAWIDEVATEKCYIEVGFPSYAAIPALQERYGDRLKLVHLVRNPVMNAMSQVTHGWYDPVKRPDLSGTVLPTPEDSVVQAYYESRWAGMTQLEKCLFFWSEFHLHALELHERFPSMGYHHVRFEDIFGSSRASKALQQLVGFLGLPWREELLGKLNESEDKWQRRVAHLEDWRDVYNHPQTLALAMRFGYNLPMLSERELKSRYLKTVSLTQRISRRVKSHFASLH